VYPSFKQTRVDAADEQPNEENRQRIEQDHRFILSRLSATHFEPLIELTRQVDRRLGSFTT
jgi:hypothetical protein